MNTPIEKLIIEIDALIKLQDISIRQYSIFKKQAYSTIKLKAEDLLIQEKKELIDAFNRTPDYDTSNGETYFRNKYGK